MRKCDNAIMSDVFVETVSGSVFVSNLTGRHRVLGNDGKFHKVRIIKRLKRSKYV